MKHVHPQVLTIPPLGLGSDNDPQITLLSAGELSAADVNI